MHILLVGDDAALPAELSEFIHAWGDEWEVTRVSDGNSAVAELASHPIDALIVAPHVVGLPPTMLLGLLSLRGVPLGSAAKKLANLFRRELQSCLPRA